MALGGSGAGRGGAREGGADLVAVRGAEDEVDSATVQGGRRGGDWLGVDSGEKVGLAEGAAGETGACAVGAGKSGGWPVGRRGVVGEAEGAASGDQVGGEGIPMGICGVEVGSVGSFVAGELQSGEK
jgi:hypothetical protein